MSKTDALTPTLIPENTTTNFCKGNSGSADKCCNGSLKELRQKNLNCPIIAQLNINSIRNKFEFLKKVICDNLDILLISETKLMTRFSLHNFYSMGFRNRID